MSYVIDKNTCIACGECAGACPTNAIGESENKYAINPDDCISCGICAGTCPVEAISE
jgi:NAD-dependent dihydropyrimidine dehydrogenase PreA subunit